MSILNSILKIFVGDKSKQDVKMISPIVKSILSFEEKVSQLSNDDLRAKTDEFKSSNFIKYSGSQDDLDIKKWLENEVFPEWDQSKQMTLDYLDKAWQIDRKTGMKYIYKLMFLMDRNYDLQLMNPALVNQIKKDARLTCSVIVK